MRYAPRHNRGERPPPTRDREGFAITPTIDYTRHFRGIFLVALATLLFEVSLIRIFSFTIWHHFGYVVISTALLGFGASGSLLAVRPGLGATNLETALWRFSMLAGLSVLAVIAFIVAVPLDPMAIWSNSGEAVIFVGYLVAATVPFFFSGVVVALVLRAGAARVDRLYFWDLVGAGLACAIAVPLMNLVSPPGVVIGAAAVFAAGAAVFATTSARRLAAVVLAVVILGGTIVAGQLPFTPARTKELALQQTFEGFVPHFTSWRALFRTDVVRDPQFPRQLKAGFPGLSRNVQGPAEAPQFFINHDATAGTGIWNLEAGPRLNFLESHILRLPYTVVNPQPDVLVIGVGGGIDLVTALQFGAKKVTGVELDPVGVDLLTNIMAAPTGNVFRGDKVELIPGEGRHFVHTSDRKFDMIQLTGVDTLSAQSSGSYVLSENFLYTTEAVHDYMSRLKEGGILSITNGDISTSEPKASGRMLSTAGDALRARGITNPEAYVVVVDSKLLYNNIMIRNRPFTPEEVDKVVAMSQQLGFVPVLLPGRPSDEVPLGLLTKTGAARQALLDRLPYLVDPITDDRPFFFMFYRWGDLFVPGEMNPSHVTALGQIVLGLLVIALTVLGAIFVLVPLVVFRRKGIAGGGIAAWGILGYFTAIGFGFMLFEISLIQSFILFLGYPTYSLSVTLFALLVFLGLGSRLSRHWVGRERTILPLAVVAIAVLLTGYLTVLPVIERAFAGAPTMVRSLVVVAALAPLGLVLGLFFPLGIRRAAEIHEDLVPWAWGINGCASVTAGVIAIVLAITYGFSRVWMISVVIYALGVAAFLLAADRQSNRA